MSLDNQDDRGRRASVKLAQDQWFVDGFRLVCCPWKTTSDQPLVPPAGLEPARPEDSRLLEKTYENDSLAPDV
jgi:hypothetical protein